VMLVTIGSTMTQTTSSDLIELRVENIAQLFHTLDPFPFRERDLDREAEEFIVGWAGELATDRTIRIIIHFPETEAQTKAAGELSEAFRDTSSTTPALFSARSTSCFGSVVARLGSEPRSWLFASCRRTLWAAT